MKLGILGGTFDPVHEGHVAMARAAAGAVGLDRVVLVPCASPPHKERPGLTDGYHRFGMLALLVPADGRLSVSAIELIRGGRSYTVETLRQLASEAPDRQLYLIVGGDSYAELTTWRDYRDILALAAIVVIPRGDWNEERLRTGLPEELASLLLPAGSTWPDATGARLPLAGIVPAPLVPVSSTEVRDRVARKLPIRGMVPEPVATYIQRQGLYD